jgi:hypothetical protein
MASVGHTDLHETWKGLEAGIEQIMTELSKGLSYQRYMELYTYPFCFIELE